MLKRICGSKSNGQIIVISFMDYADILEWILYHVSNEYIVQMVLRKKFSKLFGNITDVI